MAKMPRRFTKQRTVLGLPVGRPRTDWTTVGKAGMVGAGAVSTVAGGIQAWRRGLPTAVRKLPQQVSGQTKKVTSQLKKVPGQLGNPVRQPAGVSPGDRADARLDGATSGGTRRRPQGAKKPSGQKKQPAARGSTSRTRAGSATGRSRPSAGKS
jgi:hypothetical protein